MNGHVRPLAIGGLFLLASVFAVRHSARADEPPAEMVAATHLPFLTPGRDYVIRFAAGETLFKSTTSGVSETIYETSDGKTEKGRPAAWKMTVTIEVFHVVKLGGGSWALVEHVEGADDIIKWNLQRRAKALLTNPDVLALESDEKGAERLAAFRKQAAAEVKTTRTWVNLNHAIAITDVPTVEPGPATLQIRSIETKPSGN